MLHSNHYFHIKWCFLLHKFVWIYFRLLMMILSRDANINFVFIQFVATTHTHTHESFSMVSQLGRHWGLRRLTTHVVSFICWGLWSNLETQFLVKMERPIREVKLSNTMFLVLMLSLVINHVIANTWCEHTFGWN